MANRIILTFFWILIFSVSRGQSSITGPDCVIAGIEYQYSISSGGSGTIQICVVGGSLIGGTNNCVNGNSTSTVRVLWSNLQNGSITLSGASNNTKNVSITKELQPGLISDSLIQIIPNGTTPATIHCTAASAGGCAPSYSYQWQQSTDNVTWESINGATSQNLTFSGPLTQAMFYRRKVTNSVSNSVGYSDVATVFVIVQNQIAKNKGIIYFKGQFELYNKKVFLSMKKKLIKPFIDG